VTGAVEGAGRGPSGPLGVRSIGQRAWGKELKAEGSKVKAEG